MVEDKKRQNLTTLRKAVSWDNMIGLHSSLPHGVPIKLLICDKSTRSIVSAEWVQPDTVPSPEYVV